MTQTVADLDAQLGLEVNPLGAKMGPFYVLVGAHMPAVLVECGFLSNPYEAERLASRSTRRPSRRHRDSASSTI